MARATPWRECRGYALTPALSQREREPAYSPMIGGQGADTDPVADLRPATRDYTFGPATRTSGAT
jgi:hypothetical protein